MTPPVGFRFHPTEEEIITYYLKLKLNGQDELVDDIIGEIDVYRREPWDLPDYARMTSDDLVWYFFCRLELLYGNRARANRKTENGFWKVTGKPRDIKAKATGRVIGTKKTVVFYFKDGDSKPLRTDWVIHEYQPKTHINPLNPIVLCKLKNKSDEVAGNDEGEASIQVASDGENPATFVVGTEVLQSINLGDNMEFNLPTVLTDDVDDLAEFADSLFADPDELDDDNSFIPAIWSSNKHSGETSANHHRQVQSTRHDDILLMRASSEDSDAPRHNMIAHFSSTSEEHPKTRIHQGQSKSINLIPQVSPRVIQSPRYELQCDFSSMVSRDRVASNVKKENPPIDRHRASSFAAVPQEERMVWRVRAESQAMKKNPPIDSPPPSRFPAVAPIQKPKAPEKTKEPLGPIVSTSRDRGCGFIRMETIMASNSSTPTSVQLCNAIGGLDALQASVSAANELDFSYPSTFQPEIHVTQDTSLKNPLCKNNFSIGSSGCASQLETNESEEEPIKLAHSFPVDPGEFNINDIFMISPVLQLDYSSQLRSRRGVYLENMGANDTEIEDTGDNEKEVSGYSSSIGDSCIQDTSDADIELARTLLWQFAQLLGTSHLQDEDARSEELQQMQTMNPAFKVNPPSSDHCQHVDRQGGFDRDKIAAIEAVTRHPVYCY